MSPSRPGRSSVPPAGPITRVEARSTPGGQYEAGTSNCRPGPRLHGQGHWPTGLPLEPPVPPEGTPPLTAPLPTDPPPPPTTLPPSPPPPTTLPPSPPPPTTLLPALPPT